MTGMPNPTSRISSTISLRRLPWTAHMRSTASLPFFDKAAIPARWTNEFALMTELPRFLSPDLRVQCAHSSEQTRSERPDFFGILPDLP